MSRVNIFKRILIVCTIVVLGFGGAYYVAFSYIWRTNKNISVLQQSLDEEIRRQKDASTAEAIIVQSDSQVALVNDSIIPKDGDVAFIETLESMARANKLDVTVDSLSLENNPALASTTVTVLDIRLKMKGPWIGVYTFAKQIESLPQQVELRQLDLVQTGESDTPAPKNTKPAVEWQGLFEIRALKFK